ncbi:MAG: hypothetical protein Q4C73_11035 [Eubacteriales bacterium]|nr:hypothetical protein [Eubacteriales bacterium]
MRMYGVPESGKRVTLADGLCLHIPFGVAYGKDEDGKYNVVRYQSVPAGYRDGAFTVDDGEEIQWRISGLQRTAVINFESDGVELTPESVRGAMREKICELAKSMVQEDNSTDEPYEWGSSTKVEETEGGFALRSSISMNAAGGSYQMLELPDHLAGAVAKKGVQLFGITMHFNYLFLAVENCPEAPLFSSMLTVPEDPAFYQKTLIPLLRTAELESTGNPDKAKRPKIGRDAAPVVESLDFSKGERVPTGEFSILIPGGMCWSDEISPESRYLSCVPSSVTFDDPDWDEVSAIKFTVQTGQKIPAIKEELNSAAGEQAILKLLKNMTVAQQGAASSGVGDVVTTARDSAYYICYELAQENEIDCVFRYYLFSQNFIYVGMYVGWKAELRDPVQRHRGILEQWLGTVQYEGNLEETLIRYGKTQFGDYAAEDGRINAVTVAQLFSTDVLFFNEDDFKETGLKNGIHINALKLAEHPLLEEKRDVLTPEIVSLLLELDAVPELRVPKERLHKKLIPLLFNDHDVPLTGMTMMNLLAYHMVHIQETGSDDYTVIIDRNLVAGIPDAYRYTAAFLRHLRQYNGKDEAFTVTFATAANFDSPIQGVLKPVEGAARGACQVQVERDGGIQELEPEDPDGRQAEERSIPELEQMLPPEFTARMRTFSADIASRLARLCKTLETSSYDDLTDTDDVLDRVMGQTGDYDLGWGIFNFYNVFALGARDNIFSFVKEGEKDFSPPDGPSYRIDEQYEEYGEGDPDFRPDEFPRQLAEHIRGITEEEIYRALLEQAAEAKSNGYTIADRKHIRLKKLQAAEVISNGCTITDEARIRLEKQKETLQTVPFDQVKSVKVTGSTFVLTGEFEHYGNDREAVKTKIQTKGGRVTGAVSGKTNYLVIGGYGGFGERKIEQVKEHRAKGKDVKIIREEELFAALEDKSVQSTAPKPAEDPKKPAPRVSQPAPAEKNPTRKAAEILKGKRVSLMESLSILLPEGGTCHQEEDGTYCLSIPITLPDGSEDVWNILHFEALGAIEDAFADTEKDSDDGEGTVLTEILQSIVSKMTAAEKKGDADEAELHMDQMGGDTYQVSISMSSSVAGGSVKPLKLSGQKGAVAVEKPVTLNGKSLTVAHLFVAVGSGRDCELYRGVVLPARLEGDAFYNGHLVSLLDTLELTSSEIKKPAPLEERGGGKKKTAEKERKPKEAKKQTEERPQKNHAPEGKRVEKDIEAAAQRAIDETKQEIIDQEANIQRIQQARAEEAEKLKSIGFFKFSQKAAVREKLAQLDKALADEQQRLRSMKAARIDKIRKVLEQQPLPEPTSFHQGAVSASKGAISASNGTREKAEAIASVLCFEPMTPQEINYALGTDYTALQIANAVRYIPGASTVHVYRIVADQNGDPVLKQHTAYCLF